LKKIEQEFHGFHKLHQHSTTLFEGFGDFSKLLKIKEGFFRNGPAASTRTSGFHTDRSYGDNKAAKCKNEFPTV